MEPLVLTEDQAKEVASSVSALMAVESNIAVIKTATEAAGGDLMKLMATVFPVVITMLAPVLEKLGLPAAQPSLMKLMGAMNAHSGIAEVAAAKGAIMAMITPQK
eukprot:m.256467 g.256467  ORF g.256467 m.256467 type:complete len:105 (-) comp34391_c0_seq1:51-365(-)